MVFRSIKLTFRRFDKPFLGPAECVSCQKAGRTQHLTPGPNRYPTLWDQGSSLQLVKITFPFLSHQYFKWHQRVLLLLNKLVAWSNVFVHSLMSSHLTPYRMIRLHAPFWTLACLYQLVMTQCEGHAIRAQANLTPGDTDQAASRGHSASITRAQVLLNMAHIRATKKNAISILNSMGDSINISCQNSTIQATQSILIREPISTYISKTSFFYSTINTCYLRFGPLIVMSYLITDRTYV